MLNLSKKLFGLAGAVTMFTGMAYGQVTNTNCTSSQVNSNPLSSLTGASFIRAEGQTEFVPTLSIACTGAAGGVATVTVYFSPTVTITSALVSGSTTNTEAVATPIGGGTASTSATIAGSSITFTGIGTTAATTSIQISNVRVNATGIPLGGAPSALTAQAFFSGTNITPGPTNTATAAFVTNGLKPATFGSTPGGTDSKLVLATGSSNALGSATSSFGVCGSINNSSATAMASFYVNIAENFQSAFKTQADEKTMVGVDAAASGTRVKFVFTNVPAGLNIYMPLVLTNTVLLTAPAVTPQLSAITSETGPMIVQTAATSPTQFASLSVFQVPVSNGTATAVYEVTADNLGVTDAFVAPVFLNSGTNAVVSQSTALTMTTSFAPITAATTIPSFAILASSSPALSLLSFTQCTTSLLFPFVTNVAGFETGIAIDNTSKDPFGTRNQTGSCTLSFYGTGGTATYTSGPAPNPNEGGTGPYLPGESYAFTLTSALQAASSTNPATFQGYMIANCTYQFAHGFSYITYGFPGTSSSTMGYLAVVLTRSGSSTSPENTWQ